MKIKFSYLLTLSAMLVAGCAAYYSVFGLSQLFAGASIAVIIMASSLEFSKVVVVSFLHRYWNKISKTLKAYLTIGVIILVCITSAGIYGFLSNAYQKTANKLEIHEGELSLLDGKKLIFQNSLDDNKKIIESKNKRIEQLTGLRVNQENRMDGTKNSFGKDKVRDDISSATKEIQKLTDDIDAINADNSILSDSIGVYETKALELKTKSTVAGEVGPLKYLSKLTNTPMDKIVNYFILLLIFVFDPLAVALVLATNKVMEIESSENNKTDELPIPADIYEEITEEPIDDIEDIDQELIDSEPEIIQEEESEEPQLKIEPVQTTGKIRLEDIKEIKESNRGFSVPIPKPKKVTNSIGRVGTNKIVKDDDANKLFFKRDTK